VFKLSDGKSSNEQSVATIPQMSKIKKIILYEEEVCGVGFKLVGM
jgi:hypothetical protein